MDGRGSTPPSRNNPTFDSRTVALLNRIASKRRAALLGRPEPGFVKQQSAPELGVTEHTQQTISYSSKVRSVSNVKTSRLTNDAKLKGSTSGSSGVGANNYTSLGMRRTQTPIGSSRGGKDAAGNNLPTRPSSSAGMKPNSARLQSPSSKTAESGRLSQRGYEENRPSTTAGLTRRASTNDMVGTSHGESSTATTTREAFTTEGVPVVYRSPQERTASPERLNLDRRKLTVCPVLEGEERLRLLNYQNNLITKIDHLRNLPNLIFLDLYNNQIKMISNLECVPTLRVLMLGKNHIEKIENLESLSKLDVLDLHSNRIDKIENLNHLSELRVLNLAGNNITTVENVIGLDSLTELNLRRNQIDSVQGLNFLPSLQRVFLSNNHIHSFDAISCLFKVKYLMELAVDGNPIASDVFYRQHLLDNIKTLRHLDLKRVTEEERRISSILARKEEEKNNEKSKREAAIKHDADDANDGSNDPTVVDAVPPQRKGAEMSSDRRDMRDGGHQSSKDADEDKKAKDRNIYGRKGYAELEGESLCIYGNVLESLDKNQHVEAITFKFVTFEKVTGILPKLKKFANLTSLTFSHNNINSFIHINKLGQLKLKSLEIVDNPVSSLNLFRSYTIYRLSTLTKLNGEAVANDERVKAEFTFSNLNKVANNYPSYVDPNTLPKMSVTVTDQAMDKFHATQQAKIAANRSQSKPAAFAATYTENVMKHAIGINEKIEKLNEIWPSVVAQVIDETMCELEGDQDYAAFFAINQPASKA
eukprot:GFYU01005132.1.p1 GENE.GFYU01005132.1~~GFYU01005132.1.p1  ORF type:complete len:761 (+),score=193.01 GFYU01005132.1:205-2487(+)